jgi:hypothetical protein
VKIISGGQTGVDRAALDAARACGIPTGGWCPRGGRAEDKTNLLEAYPELRATPERDYKQRTRWNVRDADATIVFHSGDISPGTALTVRLCRDTTKPWLLVDLQKPEAAEQVKEFLAKDFSILNIAGPRESATPGIYKEVREMLETIFGELGQKEASTS